MIIVDTNVLVDVLENDPDWAGWSTARMRALSHIHALAITPIIYAELSAAFATLEELEAVVAELELEFLEASRAASFLAAKAFLRYGSRGGRRANVLADFFIGAQAAVLQCPILTRDTRRYCGYFPTVQLIAPGEFDIH